MRHSLVWTLLRLTLLLSLGIAQASAANLLEIWHWRNPAWGGSRLHDVAFGAGRYVAVGEAGTVLMSTDSKRWSSISIPAKAVMRGITFGMGQFVAVGDSGVVMTSIDGVAWERTGVGSLMQLNDVTFGGGLFVAVGNGGGILTSPDGTQWTLRAIGGDDLWAVAFGQNKFVVAGGSKGTGIGSNVVPPRAMLAVSEDGYTWTSHGSASPRPITGIVFGEGRWVAATDTGAINVSYDAMSWLPISVGIGLEGAYTLAFGNGRYVLAGGSRSTSMNRVWSSADGFDWTSYDFDSFVNPSTGIAFGNRGFVAVGGLWVSSSPSIVQSDDGLAWENLAEPARDMRGWIVQAGGYFFAGALRFQRPFNDWWNARGTDVWISRTGQEWRRTTMSPTANLNDVAWRSDRYVSVGNEGATTWSADGMVWHASDSGVTNHLMAVAAGDAGFVAVGAGGTILRSADGSTWSRANSGTTNDLHSVAWNNRFVVGDPRTVIADPAPPGTPPAYSTPAILHSLDGATWSRSELLANDSPVHLIPWQNGFAGLISGRGAISEDGITWTITGPGSLYDSPSPIGTVDGMLGYVPDHLSATLVVSTDGTNWFPRPLPWPPSVYNYYVTAVTGGQGTFVVADGYGGVAQSEPVLPRPPSLNEAPFIISGGPDREAALQINVSGSSPFAFKWKRDGAEIPGATNRWLSLPAEEPAGHLYSVEVANHHGESTSSSIPLTDPTQPVVALDFDGLFSVNIKGNTGRRYVLEMTESISTSGSPSVWAEAARFQIESDGEARLLPSDLPGSDTLFFRARVVE